MKLSSLDFRRLSVGTLLSVGVVLIIGLMVSATVYSNYLTTNALTIIRNSTTRIFDILTIQRDTEELYSFLQDIVVIQDQESLKEAKKRTDLLLDRAEETIHKAGEEQIFNEEEFAQAQKALENAKKVSASVIDSKSEALRVTEDDKSNDEKTYYEKNFNSNDQLTRLRNLRFEMLEIFHKMTMRSDNEFNTAMNQVMRARFLTWGVIAVSIALSLVLAVFLVRSVKQIFDLKNEFVNIIAHDLRNPTTAIIGYLDLITTNENKKISEIHEDIQALVVSAQKLRNLINNLLEVGRTEAGRIKLNLETIQPLEVIEESVKRAKALAEISEIKIVYKKADDKKVYVVADRSKLSDVLDNLISNAIKYNKEKGTVTISSESTTEMFSISVTDTGRGIPEDKKDQIFKKYTRLGTGKDQKVRGTGLGLYTVKLAMDQMKGTVTFESKVNEGTTFTVSFKKVNKNIKSDKVQEKQNPAN